MRALLITAVRNLAYRVLERLDDTGHGETLIAEIGMRWLGHPRKAVRNA